MASVPDPTQLRVARRPELTPPLKKAGLMVGKKTSTLNPRTLNPKNLQPQNPKTLKPYNPETLKLYNPKTIQP